MTNAAPAQMRMHPRGREKRRIYVCTRRYMYVYRAVFWNRSPEDVPVQFYMTRAGSPRWVTSSTERAKARSRPFGRFSASASDFLERFPHRSPSLNDRAANYINEKEHRGVATKWCHVRVVYSITKCVQLSLSSTHLPNH